MFHINKFAISGVRSVAFTAKRNFKVAVVGASGGIGMLYIFYLLLFWVSSNKFIGQPLSLLLKLDPNVTQLNLFDVVRTPGVAADISHVCTPAKVAGFVGMEQLSKALEGAQVVVIPAGIMERCY